MADDVIEVTAGSRAFKAYIVLITLRDHTVREKTRDVRNTRHVCQYALTIPSLTIY